MSLKLIIDAENFHPEVDDGFPQLFHRFSILKKLPVPYVSWFSITPWMLHPFLHETNSTTKIRLLMQSQSSVEEISNNIQRYIDRTNIPKSLSAAIKAAYKKHIGNQFFQISFIRSFDGQLLMKEPDHPLKGDVVLIALLKEAWKHSFQKKIISANRHLPQRLLTPPYIFIQACAVPNYSVKVYTRNPHNQQKGQWYIEINPGITTNKATYKPNPHVYLYDPSSRTSKKITNHIIRHSISLDRFGHYQVKQLQHREINPSTFKDLHKYCQLIEQYERHPLVITANIIKGKTTILDYKPLYITHQHDSNFQKSSMKKPSPIITGLSAGQGITTGPVRIILRDSDLQKIEPNDIVVVKTAHPNITPYVSKMGALISETGGITSHTALIAREFGIPSIMSANNATQILKSREVVTVNGLVGEVYNGTLPDNQKPTKEDYHAQETATKIMLDMSSSRQLGLITNMPNDGIGLIRGEVIAAQDPTNLTPAKYSTILARELNILAQTLGSNVISIKLYDLPSNDRFNNTITETNPFIGNRGAFWSLYSSSYTNSELTVLSNLVQTHPYLTLRLVIPFVRFPDEIIGIKKRIASLNLSLKHVELYPSLDTPAALFSLKEFASQSIDGIYVNTNHLTALILGIDPENSSINHRYDQKHPVLITLYQDICRKAQEYNLPVFFYGHEVNQSAYLLHHLVQYGVTGVVINPRSVPFVSHTIYQAEKERVG